MFTAGCDIINPQEKVPTYLHIDSFNFVSTDPARHGSISNKITSVWVYYDNVQVGVFDLPANVPVIAEGTRVVQLRAGISYNGMNNYQIRYPFYTFDSMSVTADPGKVKNVSPKTQYSNSVKFEWKEDFETGNSFRKVDDGLETDTSIVRTTDGGRVFEGAAAGFIYVDDQHANSQNISNNSFPYASGDVFLELNYKCNIPFEVGLQTTISGGIIVYDYFGGINAKEEWNKIYINLAQFMSENKGNEYRIMIKANKGSKTNGYVLLDNLKVVSF